MIKESYFTILNLHVIIYAVLCDIQVRAIMTESAFTIEELEELFVLFKVMYRHYYIIYCLSIYFVCKCILSDLFTSRNYLLSVYLCTL